MQGLTDNGYTGPQGPQTVQLHARQGTRPRRQSTGLHGYRCTPRHRLSMLFKQASVPVKASQQQATMNQIEFDAGMSLCCRAAQLFHRCWPKDGAAIAFSAGCACNSGWGLSAQQAKGNAGLVECLLCLLHMKRHGLAWRRLLPTAWVLHTPSIQAHHKCGRSCWKAATTAICRIGSQRQCSCNAPSSNNQHRWWGTLA